MKNLPKFWRKIHKIYLRKILQNLSVYTTINLGNMFPKWLFYHQEFRLYFTKFQNYSKHTRIFWRTDSQPSGDKCLPIFICKLSRAVFAPQQLAKNSTDDAMKNFILTPMFFYCPLFMSKRLKHGVTVV